MKALFRGNYFIKREMVLKICIKLSKFRENDGRKGSKSRPYNNHEMGTSILIVVQK